MNYSSNPFFLFLREVKKHAFSKNCKICQSPYATALLYRYHVEHLPYVQLIELYKKYGLELNVYNVSCHLHRHVQQRDIEEVEKLKARWVSMDAQLPGLK